MATGRRLITIGYELPATAVDAAINAAIGAKLLGRIIRALSNRHPRRLVHEQEFFGVDQRPLQVFVTLLRALTLFEEASRVLTFGLRRVPGQRREVNLVDDFVRGRL